MEHNGLTQMEAQVMVDLLYIALKMAEAKDHHDSAVVEDLLAYVTELETAIEELCKRFGVKNPRHHQ